jgi:hypothetical protein
MAQNCYELSRRSTASSVTTDQGIRCLFIVHRLSQAVWQRLGEPALLPTHSKVPISLGTLTSKENPAQEDPDASRAKALL